MPGMRNPERSLAGLEMAAMAVSRLLLLDERAAGQTQEDVLQAAASHERRLRLEAALMHGFSGCFSIVRVNEDAVGQLLDPLADAIEPAVERLLYANGETQFEHLAR